MKNVESWRPSKYVMRRGRLVASRDRAELLPSSRWIAQLVVDAYAHVWEKHVRGEFLDLGCGKVPFYERYRDHVTRVTCVDWPGSPHGNLHVDRFCDLSQPLPFSDAQFQTLLSSDVIEHLPDPQLAFKEMGRVLKPGGILLLNTPFLYMLHELPHDFYRYTRYSLTRLVEVADMEVVELKEIGGIGDVFVDLVAKTLGQVPIVGAPLCIGWQGFLSLVAGTGAWRRLREGSALRFPSGYLLVARKRVATESSCGEESGKAAATTWLDNHSP